MERARLSFIQIWNMSFGFFGIQIGFGLQNANTSRIFQSLGANIDDLAILWIAAPATGLLVQPIIGYLSDRTWTKLGRRRPYFLIGAILTTLALMAMPHSPTLWIAAGALWIMDASINITMEPFRAFVGDNLPERQRTTGYAVQSFFIGLGAVLASALPWMMTNWFGVSNTAAGGGTPDSVKLAFYIGGACLLAAVLWTVLSTKEYTPEELDIFERKRIGGLGEAPRQALKSESYFRTSGASWFAAGLGATAIVYGFRLEKELFLLAALISAFGAAQIVVGVLIGRGHTNHGVVEIIGDMFSMPPTMRDLTIVQFFSWFALFAMWIYATAAVTTHHYGTLDTTSQSFNDGADWVGVLFAIYNGVAAFAAILIPFAAARLGRRAAHAFNLVLGAVGLFSFLWISDPALLWLPMIGVGFAWASILSMPYAILAGSLPTKKMGVFMGIFNIFIVAPQLVAATVLGVLLKTFFNGEAIYALALGGASWLIAALCTLRVKDQAESQTAPRPTRDSH
ncbi:MAG TPA: MFS transporter [Terricaulis sp.]|nr:MFS transporter [Terricaulis sp.]